MNIPTTPAPGLWRRRTPAAIALAVALMTLTPSGLLAAEPSAGPGAASPRPSMTPAQAACESADDLRLIVGFLRDIDVSEDGWVPVMVGAIAGLSEARDLARAADATYRPLVDGLVASLEGLRSTVDGLGTLETTGAQVAAVGEATAAIGNAMDALTVQLQAPCPSPGATAT